MKEYITSSADETVALGKKIGKALSANSVLCFFGDLGTGKTTFIKGLVTSAAEVAIEQVLSPTFVYLNIYQGRIPVFHFDLYRLKDSQDFLRLGFDEFLESGGVSCIEWSERIASLIPQGCLRIEMRHLDNNRRKVVIMQG